MTKALYKFHWSVGRMGDVSGLFVAEKEEVASCLGREVYFGEILGKHSEIFGTLDESDLTVVTDKPEHIQALEWMGLAGTISGHNPLEYLDEWED